MLLPILGEILTSDLISAALKWTVDKVKTLKPSARTDVEFRIRRLSLDLENTIRHRGKGEVEPAIHHLFEQFQRDVVKDGVSAEDAPQLVAEIRAQMQALIIEPSISRLQMVEWIRQVEERVKTIELESEKAQSLEPQIRKLEIRVHNLSVALAVAITLALIATVLSFLILIRK